MQNYKLRILLDILS